MEKMVDLLLMVTKKGRMLGIGNLEGSSNLDETRPLNYGEEKC